MPKATNIMTNGLEFVEFSGPSSDDLHQTFIQLGFTEVGQHRTKNVTLYKQGDIHFILNCEPESIAAKLVSEHGPTLNAMAFRVSSVVEALNVAESFGLEIVHEKIGPMELNIPAIVGVGGSLIYLIDRYGEHTIYDVDFKIDQHAYATAEGDFHMVDHITQNVYEGHLDVVVDFYKRVFGFSELQHFNIQGKHTGLKSTALISACGKIKIPVNEPTDQKSQIREYLNDHHGEGVQHIALATNDIYAAVDNYVKRGGSFQETPGTYYDAIPSRVDEHIENIGAMRKRGILIDGSRDSGILLQIFTNNIIGPLFFEVIQRKENKGFGEGNFQALFESIEREQEHRGVFDETG